MMRRRSFPLVCLAILSLLACSYPISSQYRRMANRDLKLPQVLQDAQAHSGEMVIWGGVVLETRNVDSSTELSILETDLDMGLRPSNPMTSTGRFIARVPQFLDPEVYRRGLKITVAGTIDGSRTLPLGKGEYTYPILDVKQLHLWRPDLAPPPQGFYSWGWDWYDRQYWPYYRPPYFYDDFYNHGLSPGPEFYDPIYDPYGYYR